MKYSVGDIITAKTLKGTRITGKAEVDEDGDYYIDIGLDIQYVWLTVFGEVIKDIEIIKVERQLPTKPGSVIRNAETRSGSEFALGVLVGSTNSWYLFSKLGDLLIVSAEGADNSIEVWEPDAA